MRPLRLAAALLAAAIAIPAAAGDYTTADIAKLPQDKVATIKKQCANEWANDFHMRVFCEDRQYDGLRELIDRGSIDVVVGEVDYGYVDGVFVGKVPVIRRPVISLGRRVCR